MRIPLAPPVAVLTVLCVCATAGCRDKSPAAADAAAPATLTVFHAGSLAVPFRELGELFRQRHPHVEIRAEAAGSRDTARKVSDLDRRCDVLGSADYRVVENLLMPEHATFNIRFATNEMVIAYTDRSTAQGELTPKTWPDVMLREKVTFGRADPNRDPCGYRTEMVFQLAEHHLKRPGLAAQLGAKHGRKFIRPKETDLLVLLESGEIDYLFIYRSVATQHHLRFFELPGAINLGSPEHAAEYGRAKVQITGRKPGEHITREGAAITYSVTIPKGASERELAVAYLELLLSPEGQQLMARNGQQPIVPARVDRPDELPPSLRPLCRKAD